MDNSTLTVDQSPPVSPVQAQSAEKKTAGGWTKPGIKR